jgi:hypothetical protein
MSAAAAISATVVSSYPLRSNSAAAASISARRVRSRLRSRSDSDPASLKTAVRGAYGVFSVQSAQPERAHPGHERR